MSHPDICPDIVLALCSIQDARCSSNFIDVCQPTRSPNRRKTKIDKHALLLFSGFKPRLIAPASTLSCTMLSSVSPPVLLLCMFVKIGTTVQSKPLGAQARGSPRHVRYACRPSGGRQYLDFLVLLRLSSGMKYWSLRLTRWGTQT